MKLIKNTIYFTLIIISLIIFFHFFLILFADSYRFIFSKKDKINPNVAQVSRLDLYKTISWSEEFFSEYSSLSQNYRSFIGWRTKEFKGNQININNENNRFTIYMGDNNDETKNLFFGGSVTWGYGNNDSNTIPSHYYLISREKSENLGERSWILDQDLIYLIQQYNQSKIFSNVFFIFGVNDIYIKCLSGNLFAHGQDKKVRNQLNKKSIDPASFENFFSVFKKYYLILKLRIASLKKKQTNSFNLNYCKDKNFAESVAENIIKNINNSKKIVQSNNDNFYAVLQPVHFYSKDQVHLDNAFQWLDEESFIYIYNLIVKNMKDENYFIDLKDIFLENSDVIFTDTGGHLSPTGNQLFAEKLFLRVTEKININK